MNTDDEKLYQPSDWMQVIHLINKHVRTFKQTLAAYNIDANTTYIAEWNNMYSDMANAFNDNNLTQYKNVTEFMFGDPTTFEEFIEEALRMVPPVKVLFTLTKSTKRGSFYIKIEQLTQDVIQQQLDMHKQYQPVPPTATDDASLKASASKSSSIGVNSDIRKQVQEMELTQKLQWH